MSIHTHCMLCCRMSFAVSFFFSSRRRHTRWPRDWSSDVCSSDLFCQAIATVSFQTVTNNRIITPSIMGFESLYVAVQTGAMYFFGVTAIVDLKGLTPFAIQPVVQVERSLAR